MDSAVTWSDLALWCIGYVVGAIIYLIVMRRNSRAASARPGAGKEGERG